MKRLLALAALLLSILAPGIAVAAAPPLLLGDLSSYLLAGHLEQLVDPGGQLTLADVLSPSVAARFTPIPGNMSRGYTGDAVWLRFRLERTAAFPEQAYLCLEPAYLNTIEVYAHAGGNPDDPAAYRQTLAGDHVPLSDRAIRTTGYAIPIVLPAAQPCQLLIRVRSTSSVALVGSVQTTTALVSAINRNVLFDSGYLAVALIIALINLIYFLRLRDRLFLFFALHILSLFFNQIALAGILNVLLPRQAYLLSDYLAGGGFGLGASFFALIALSLFRHTAGGFSRALFRGIFALGLLTALAAPLDLYRTVAPLLVIAMFVLIMVLFRLGLGAVRRNEPGGRLYLAAFGLSNLGYAVQFLRLLGLLPTEWWSLHALQLTTFCNMALMSLALTERVHAAEEQALQAAREAEQRAGRGDDRGAAAAEGKTGRDPGTADPVCRHGFPRIPHAAGHHQDQPGYPARPAGERRPGALHEPHAAGGGASRRGGGNLPGGLPAGVAGSRCRTV